MSISDAASVIISLWLALTLLLAALIGGKLFIDAASLQAASWGSAVNVGPFVEPPFVIADSFASLPTLPAR